jgi:hypothetical protein
LQIHFSILMYVNETIDCQGYWDCVPWDTISYSCCSHEISLKCHVYGLVLSHVYLLTSFFYHCVIFWNFTDSLWHKILTALYKKIIAFFDVAPCISIDMYRRFGKICLFFVCFSTCSMPTGLQDLTRYCCNRLLQGRMFYHLI